MCIEPQEKEEVKTTVQKERGYREFILRLLGRKQAPFCI